MRSTECRSNYLLLSPLLHFVNFLYSFAILSFFSMNMNWINVSINCIQTRCAGGRHNMSPLRASGDSGRWHINCWHRDKLCGDLNSQPKRPMVTLTFDLLTLKVVPESCVMCATSVPILVFLCLSVLDLGPMYATGVVRQTSDTHHRLMPPHNKPVMLYKPVRYVTRYLINSTLLLYLSVNCKWIRQLKAQTT